MTNTPYPSPMEQCVGGPAEELCKHSGSYISIHFYEGVPSKQLLLHVNTNTNVIALTHTTGNYQLTQPTISCFLDQWSNM